MEASTIYNKEKITLKRGREGENINAVMIMNIQTHLLNKGKADSGQKRAILTKNNCVMISSIG